MLSAIVGILGTAVLAIIAWAINMQSRVSVLEADKAEAVKREAGLKELIDAKLETILTEQRNQSQRLARIEAKLDRE